MPTRFSAFGRVFAPSWPMTLLTLVLLTLFVGLGRWQWHRGEAKQAVWAQFERNAPAQALTGHARFRQPRSLRTHVELHGHFEPERQFLLDNRSHAGQPGYEVLTPFRPERWAAHAGEPRLGSRSVVIATDCPMYPWPLRQRSTITGRIDELPSGGLASGHAAPDRRCTWPKLTSFPTHDELASALGAELQRRILLLDAEVPDGYVREWSPPGMPPSRHFSYAIQWWGFAGVLLVLYFGLNFRKVS